MEIWALQAYIISSRWKPSWFTSGGPYGLIKACAIVRIHYY